MSDRHVILTDAHAHGFQYGMQIHFENEIARITGGLAVPAPKWKAPSRLRGKLAHGARLSPLRALVPRTQSVGVSADVMWVVLMGPENTDLDLLARWDRHTGYRILYLFDTFPMHLPSIRRVVNSVRWDLTVTSFHAAVPMLERETGRRWHAVSQGVLPQHFTPVATTDRQIAVSSYGRRFDPAHRSIDAWSKGRDLHYDITIASALQRDVESLYLYRQYAWHLRNSWFTVAWPVELTHPARADGLSAVTCRWFEAAASGVPIVGAPPKDPVFEQLFGKEAVIPLSPDASFSEQAAVLDSLWDDRDEHVRRALERRAQRLQSWTWEAKVRELLSLANLSVPTAAPDSTSLV